MQELQFKKNDNNEIQREYQKLKKEQINEKAWSVYSEVDIGMQKAINQARDKGSPH